MKENIFLGGGGDQDASKLIDKRFVEIINTKKLKKIIYIPIAMTSRPYSECLDWFSQIFANKVREIEMWENLDAKSLKDMENKVAIYIGGGNTVRLKEKILEAGFDKELSDFVGKGGVVYGGSAGAIILGKDIRTAPEAEKTSKPQGLALLGDFSIACHFKTDDVERVAKLSHVIGTIIAIQENAGVIYNETTITGVGPGDVYKINGGFKKIVH